MQCAAFAFGAWGRLRCSRSHAPAAPVVEHGDGELRELSAHSVGITYMTFVLLPAPRNPATVGDGSRFVVALV